MACWAAMSRGLSYRTRYPPPSPPRPFRPLHGLQISACTSLSQASGVRRCPRIGGVDARADFATMQLSHPCGSCVPLAPSAFRCQPQHRLSPGGCPGRSPRRWCMRAHHRLPPSCPPATRRQPWAGGRLLCDGRHPMLRLCAASLLSGSPPSIVPQSNTQPHHADHVACG